MTRSRLPLPIVGLVVPAAISLAAVVAAVLVAPDRDVVVHWSAAGDADGWAPAWTVVAGMAVLGVLGAVAFGLPLVATRRESPTVLMRVLAATAVGFAVLMAVLGLWILLGQSDPESVPSVGVGLGLGFGIAVPVAVLAWLVAPPAVPVEPSGAVATPLPLADGERAVWISRTRLATPGLVAILAAVLGSLGAAVVANLVTAGGIGALFVVPVVLLAALLLTSFWTVRVDDAGLTVRNPLGWPAFRMRADEVASAGVTRVSAIGDFGGWGVRAGSGRRLGIVMRSGEALEAQNRDGRALVVTVDDAGTAAALLAAVAERAATAGRG